MSCSWASRTVVMSSTLFSSTSVLWPSLCICLAISVVIAVTVAASSCWSRILNFSRRAVSSFADRCGVAVRLNCESRPNHESSRYSIVGDDAVPGLVRKDATFLMGLCTAFCAPFFSLLWRLYAIRVVGRCSPLFPLLGRYLWCFCAAFNPGN